MLDLKVIPPLQLLIAIVLMWILATALPNLNYILPLAKTMAILITIIAIIMGLLAVYSFKKHHTTVNPTTPEKASKVVNTGAFSYSRNPMYLALFLVLIALSIILQNSATFAVLPLFITYITQFQIKPEERALHKLFGDEYLTYCQQVRRWL